MSIFKSRLQTLLWLGISLCLMSACGSRSHRVDQYAPPPPASELSELSFVADPDLMARAQSFSEADLETNDGPLSSDGLALDTSKVLKRCRIKDKFDRKALLAYEWAGGERLSLDVDGIGMEGTDISKVYFQYKVSLQPDLEKRDPCKYASAYQGILGSMYQEFMVHDGQHLTNEVDVIQSKVSKVFASITN